MGISLTRKNNLTMKGKVMKKTINLFLALFLSAFATHTFAAGYVIDYDSRERLFRFDDQGIIRDAQSNDVVGRVSVVGDAVTLGFIKDPARNKIVLVRADGRVFKLTASGERVFIGRVRTDGRAVDANGVPNAFARETSQTVTGRIAVALALYMGTN
jgi:hypothetical protein